MNLMRNRELLVQLVMNKQSVESNRDMATFMQMIMAKMDENSYMVTAKLNAKIDGNASMLAKMEENHTAQMKKLDQ